MSVQSETSRISYPGNASTVTQYPVPFYFPADADIVVIVRTVAGVETTLTLSSDYALTGAGNELGGNMVTTAAIPSTSTVVIFRIVELKQDVDFVENGDLPASTIENALDKLTMAAQQNDRAVKASIRVNEVEGERTELTAVANSILGLDSSKQPTALTVSELKTFLSLSGTTLDVAAGMKTFADAGERALAVPEFTGQLGTQRDTNLVYISTGTSAGNWTVMTVTLAMLAASTFTADATGRGKFANGFVNDTLLASDAVTTAKVLNLAITAGKLATVLDLSGKTLTMPTNHWRDLAPAGTVLQTVLAETATESTVSAVTALDNTIPQNTEGTQILNASITPFSTSSKILVTVSLQTAASASVPTAVIALFKGSTANAFFSFAQSIASQTLAPMGFAMVDAPASSSAIDYKVRLGVSTGTVYVNRYVTGSYYGGTAKSSLILQEIKG